MEVLEIFDFDWTLFRSPSSPDGVPNKRWLASADSLLPPHVPLRPGSSYWIEEVVREIRAAQNRSNTITAIITARRAGASDRIRELLEQKRIRPDYFICRGAGFQGNKDKRHFKRISLIKILKKHPYVDKVIAWEDLEGHLDDYRDISLRRDIQFEDNLVTEPGGMHDYE